MWLLNSTLFPVGGARVISHKHRIWLALFCELINFTYIDLRHYMYTLEFIKKHQITKEATKFNNY